MKMCNQTGTFKKTYFDNKICDIDGTELTITTDFTVVGPSTILAASVNTPNVLAVGVHTLEAGDSIKIKGSDGVLRDNFVQNVGPTTIEIRDNVKPSSSTTVDIYVDFYTVTMALSADGLYYFTDNEALIISETYLNLYITYAELYAQWDGVSRDVTMNIINTRALENVLADFSFYPAFYKNIDLSQIKQLIIYKMLTSLMRGDDKEAAVIQYATYKSDMVSLVVRDSDDGSVSPDITDENVDSRVKLGITYGAC